MTGCKWQAWVSHTIYKITSGIKPPWMRPNKARVPRNDARLESQNWPEATILHMIIWVGTWIAFSCWVLLKEKKRWNFTHRSGPNFLLISCDGSSASKKATLKTVLPRLKSREMLAKNTLIWVAIPLVVSFISFRKLSVFAWARLLRFRFRAKSAQMAQTVTFQSIFRTSF